MTKTSSFITMYFSKVTSKFCSFTCTLVSFVYFILKYSLDQFDLLTHMHFVSAHFDCSPFYHRDIKSIINCIYISMILQTLTVNLGLHQKCSQLGPAVPKAGPDAFQSIALGLVQTSNFSCAESNANRFEHKNLLINIGFGTWKVRRLKWALLFYFVYLSPTSISALFLWRDLAISKCPSLQAKKNGEQPFFVRQSTFPPLF